MIDAKLLRSDPDAVAHNLARRGFALDVTALKALDERRKLAQVESDRLRSERNAHAKAVGMAKGRGEDIAPLIAKGDELTKGLANVDKQLADIQAELDALVAGLPNLLHESVPEGRDESANVEVRRWGEPRKTEFEPKDHVAQVASCFRIRTRHGRGGCLHQRGGSSKKRRLLVRQRAAITSARIAITAVIA